jgi:four helix bundle protein
MKFCFEELDVWKLAFDFGEKIYTATKKFPRDEVYGISMQIRRASLSVSLNIAEGKGRYSVKEFKKFLLIARGSLYETITLLMMCLKLGYLTSKEYEDRISDGKAIQSKISGLINYLKTRF